MLQVRDLSVRFGRRRRVAVDGVSFDINADERVGLIGESGSGKSVTALAIMGLLPENAEVSGSVRLHGEELIGATDRQLRGLRGARMSMVFQEPMTALDPTMKVGRQLGEVHRLHSRGTDDRSSIIEAALQRVGLGIGDIANTYPHELSGGQRQRIMTAMALLNDPDLVICDEPTTALDVVVQADILQVLRRELDACLFITHDIAVMAQICDRVAVMLDGRIVETGTVREVLADPQHGYTKGLIATSRMQLIGDRLPVVDDYFVREPR